MNGLFRFPKAVNQDPAIDAWLAKQVPELGAIARTWFLRMRSCGSDVREIMHDGCPTAKQALSKLRHLLPGAVELIYDNYNALAVGFSPTDRASDVICPIAVYPKWVSLFFMRGVRLADPAGILPGSGNQVCHIVLEDAQTLERPEVRALLAQAVSSHPKAVDGGKAQRIIIKSVSTRQRPRKLSRGRPAQQGHEADKT